MGKLKRVMTMLLVVLLLLNSIIVFADDNADTGSGDTNNAVKDKGYYRGSEYMYKVTVYVGLSDKNSNLKSEWMMIGNKPIYIKPSNFTLSSKEFYGLQSKADYLNGSNLVANSNPIIITDNPPPIPITNGGNINSVKSYFGDTGTLNMLINKYSSVAGITKEGLVSDIQFSINDESKTYPPEEILPIKINGKYQNKVPWLIVYEPVIISYLKDRKTVLAFTATEYALAQKLGYFNFKYGSTGQSIAKMTHSDLPNSIILEESWFNYAVTSPLADKVLWSEDRIISGGGWGMRMLKANATNIVENDTTYDYEYRVDTDVITSVRVYASKDVTPDNRHESEFSYKNPIKNTATIIMSANGYSKSTEVVIPSGGSELIWIKWHTPSTPQDVEINVQVTGNSGAKIDGTSRNAIIKGKIADLGENVPPNPTANDKNKSFIIPNIPTKADKTNANWGVYSCKWIASWVWYSNWEWESKWVINSYTTHHSGGCKVDGSCPGHIISQWVDLGRWVDKGRWVDEGHWQYNYKNYNATLSASMNITPDEKVPTSNGEIIKSGYGFNVDITTQPYTNAPNSHLTNAQNTITYFPEFEYQNFWRLLDMTSIGNFEFKINKYSTYNNRVHFTPIWYPDGSYIVYSEVIDMWTPDGMLRINLNDDITIDGNLYEDWHIGPK